MQSARKSYLRSGLGTELARHPRIMGGEALNTTASKLFRLYPPIDPSCRRRCGSTPVLMYIEYAPLRCYGAVTVPWRLSIITGELRKSIVGGPPNLASTIALHSPP